MFKRFRFVYALLIGVILAMLLVYVRLPYYITKPGMAEKLEPYVQVDGGTKESGDFMLVTVSMGRANVVNFYPQNLINIIKFLRKKRFYNKMKVMKTINFAKYTR